ncbi:MAG: phage holin family protein [bacterium]
MQPVTWQSTPVLLLIGLIFRFIYHVARPLLKFLATPINFLTLGLAGILLNMIALYGFVFILQALNLGVTVTLGSIEQTFVLSIIISILTLVLKKIL